MEEYQYEGFEELESQGFVSEYIQIDHKNKVIRPSFTADHIKDSGFITKGSKVRFLNRNGYDMERERAAKVFDTENAYTVKSCHVGGWSSDYSFEEVDGLWNTVMFGKYE